MADNRKPAAAGLAPWQQELIRALRQQHGNLPLVYTTYLADRQQSVPRLRQRLLDKGYAWTPSVRHLRRLLRTVQALETELRPDTN